MIYRIDLKRRLKELTVDVTGPRVPILVERLAEKEAVKSRIIMMPDTSNEKLEQNDALDIAGVLVASEQRTLLDAKVGDRILSGIQIDDEGHLIIREEEHLATLRGIANAASGNKPVLQSEDLLADRREDVFHGQDKL
jgi:co-chaperonin GroES (HSP10)